MRDADRIQKIMFYLAVIWRRNPNTAFNQFIHGLQWEFNEACDGELSDTLYRKHIHDAAITFEQADVVDLYHVSDQLFLEFLKEKAKRVRQEEKTKLEEEL